MLRRITVLWLMLENVQDPGNLGTMFRTGEGAGIAGVIMDRSPWIFTIRKQSVPPWGVFSGCRFLSQRICMRRSTAAERTVSVYAAHLEGSVCYDTRIIQKEPLS